jgi:peroxiredoxin
MHGRWIRAGGVAFVTVVVAYGLFRYATANAPARVQPGGPAPQFSAVTLDSIPRARTLADFRGSPILLNVWATWCDPCREEMPSMQRLFDAYKDRGLRIVAVSVDDRGNEGLIREFVAEHHLTFDILQQGASDMMTTYQVRGVPQTFLISRTGELVATRFVADWSSAESRQIIDRLLAGSDAAR